MRVVRVLTAAAILVALGTSFYFRDHLRELKRYGYVAVFAVGLVSNATLIVPVPGLAISSVMGGVLNPGIVGLVGGIGQALGELTGFLAGYSGQTWAKEHASYKRLAGHVRRYGVLVIFVLALVPNPLFDIGGVVAGALRFPVWKFFLSCTAGKVTKNVVFALAGSYGIEVVFQLFGWAHP